MELIAKIVMLASCAVCVLVQTVYFTHMMQLNSYRTEGFLHQHGAQTLSAGKHTVVHGFHNNSLMSCFLWQICHKNTICFLCSLF